MSGWEAEAARLRRFLDVITAQVAAQHDQSLRWLSETLTAQEWSNPDSITEEVLENRLRSEEHSLIPGGTSTGVVQGHLDDADVEFVRSMWTVGGDEAWQFFARQNFNTEDDEAAKATAKRLNEYPASWLASLLSETAQCVEAAEARIHTIGVFKAVKKARKDARGRVGALNLVPHGIGHARLPDSISVFPSSSDAHPEGVILAVDLDTAVGEPAAVVDDLLIIDDILTANAAS